MHNLFSTIILVFMLFFATQGALQSMEEVQDIEMKPYKGGQFVDADYDFLEKGERKQIVVDLLSQECLKRAEQLAQLSEPPTKKWDDVSEDVWYLVTKRLPRVDQYSLRLTNLFFSQVVARVIFGDEIDLNPEMGLGLPLKKYLAAIYRLNGKLDTVRDGMRVAYHRAICERIKVLAQLRYGLKWADRKDFYSLASKYHIPIVEDTWAEKLRAYQFWYFYSDTCPLRNLFLFSAFFAVTGSIIGEWALMPARVPGHCKSPYFVPIFSERNTMATSYGYLDKGILTGITMVPILASTIYFMVIQIPVNRPFNDACFRPDLKKTVSQGIAFVQGRPERAKARSKTRILDLSVTVQLIALMPIIR
jgi:hypothetical protein